MPQIEAKKLADKDPTIKDDDVEDDEDEEDGGGDDNDEDEQDLGGFKAENQLPRDIIYHEMQVHAALRDEDMRLVLFRVLIEILQLCLRVSLPDRISPPAAVCGLPQRR